MPGLSIGNFTPFSQASNYHTVLNHRFREESAYDPAKQVKIKCPYCGIWAKKGSTCSLCGTRVPGNPPSQLTSSSSLPAKRHSAASDDARHTEPSRSARARSKSPASGGGRSTPVTTRQQYEVSGSHTSHTPSRLSFHQGLSYQTPTTARGDQRRFGSPGVSLSTNVPHNSRQVHYDALHDDPYLSQYGSENHRNSQSSGAAVEARRVSELSARKVKCSYCGIWVQTGKMCTLCRTPAK